MNVNSDKVMLGIAIVAVIASIAAAGFSYYSVLNLSNSISGYVSGATANLTVESAVVVNFTTDAVNWASGRVDPGSQAASLVTTGTTGTVSGGNWTAQTGLILENEGNVNTTLNLSGTKTAATFIGGTNPVYEWNITANEATSCVNGSNGSDDLNLTLFQNVSTAQHNVCPIFQFLAAKDEIRIDFNVTVPEDSSTGALTDTITATVHAT